MHIEDLVDSLSRNAEMHIEDLDSVSARHAILHIGESLFISTIPDARMRISEDKLWFSLTDLFKSSGKQVGRYLRAEGTKRFFAKLAVHLGISVDDLLIVNKGGNPQEQGTWIHKRALMHGLAECSDDVKVWFFGEIGFEILSGNDIKHSDAMQSLKSVNQSLSQSDVDILVQKYESRIDELEALTDELSNDLALKDHQLNQMKYFVEEADVLGRWQQENSWS